MNISTSRVIGLAQGRRARRRRGLQRARLLIAAFAVAFVFGVVLGFSTPGA